MKTKTITSVALCMAMASCLSISAQKRLNVKEVGLGFAGLNNFSLQYRWGTEEKLYRLSGSLGSNTNFGKSNSSYTDVFQNPNDYITSGDSKTPFNLNTSLNFSIFKLNSFSEKFGFMYGTFFGTSYSLLKDENSQVRTSTSYSSGPPVNYPVTTNSKTERQIYGAYAGIAIGIFYKLSQSFLLYAEIDPNIYYNYSATKSMTIQKQSGPTPATTILSDRSQNNSFGVSGLSNSYAALTFVYRINAKKA